MKNPILPLTLLLTASMTLSGCGKIPGVNGASNQSTEAAKPLNVAGDWNVGFKFNEQTLNATMHLKQDGAAFEGTGKDDPSGTPFTIEQGQVRGDQISFVKKYGGKLASSPPIQYAGSITSLAGEDYSGPYMKGDYAAADAQGKTVSNDWDAVLDKSSVAGAPDKTQAADTNNVSAPKARAKTQNSGMPSISASQSQPDRPPDLSGKWEVAYEYKFRTVKSIMFLEQEFDRVVGHGLDDNKEKFGLDKVFYAYPKITLIRRYGKVAEKVKGKIKDVGSGRLMTFKGDVSVVNDADYQGPYMHGKTDGGGEWVAMRVK